MPQKIRSRIAGVGLGTPGKILTNKDLEKIVDTSDEWIQTRTGIRERKVIDRENGQSHTSICADAALQACERAGKKPEDVEMVICCTLSPDTFMPHGAAQIVGAMGAGEAASYDLGAACAGWVMGVQTADALIRSGFYKNIMVVGVEALSSFLNWEDRTTCVLFGDGAGATLLEACEIDDEKTERCVIDSVAYTWPDKNMSLAIKGSGSQYPPTSEGFKENPAFVSMNGQEVFKSAAKGMVKVCKELLERNQVSMDDIKWMVPHQANLRIIEMVAKLMRFPMERTFVNIDRWANTSAGTIPIALAEMHDEKKLEKGDLILTVTFGGGFSFGAALIRW